MPKELSLTTSTLYAELRELALSIALVENIASTPGSIVTKKLGKGHFVYYQYRDLDGKTKQRYLGTDNNEMRAVLANIDARSESLKLDRQRMLALGKAFLAAGGSAIPHAPFRVIKGFSDAGVLRPIEHGATLIGTYAFAALGNLLGVQWDSQLQTNDIDLAASDNVNMAVTEELPRFEDILSQLEMGFIPVPSLNAKHPSSSYRVRGKELRVDLLTPQLGKASNKPKYIKALNAVAEPIRHLDFLLEDVVPALLISTSGVVLANVPSPERYCLHKLIVSESRAPSFRAKAQKDRIQALQLLEVLLESDLEILEQLVSDIKGRGPRWAKKLKAAVSKCSKTSRDTVATLKRMTD